MQTQSSIASRCISILLAVSCRVEGSDQLRHLRHELCFDVAVRIKDAAGHETASVRVKVLVTQRLQRAEVPAFKTYSM